MPPPLMEWRRMSEISPDKQGLKNATRALVRAVGGQEACPPFARYQRHQSYSDFASIEQPDKFMPVDVVADLEGVTHGKAGHPIVTAWLCRMAGGTFVRVPDSCPDEGSFLAALSALTCEFSDLSRGVMSALADGKVTPEEIDEGRLLGKCDDLASKVMQIRALLERAAAGEG